MPDEAPKNVTEAIARIMTELPAIGKKKDPNGGVKYAFRGIEAITAEAQELCAKYSVVFYPTVLKMKTKDIIVNGNPWTDTFLDVQYKVVHGPSDTSESVRTRGIGRDNSDKGANKAMTAAYKYALLQVFMIADPKDDGDRESHATESRATESRANGSRRADRGTVRRAPSRSDVDPETGEIAGGVAEPTAKESTAPPADIESMKPRELSAALAKAGLPVAGTVPELRARLAEHLSGATSNGAVAVAEREQAMAYDEGEEPF